MTGFLAALVIAAAPPVAPLSGLRGTTAAAISAPSAALTRGGIKPPRLRFDSFVPGFPPDERSTLRPQQRPFTFTPADAFPDSLDVTFLANARPLRVRVTVTLNKTPLADVWAAHVRKLFAGFDRDGDGWLNRLEADHIFAAQGVTGLLRGNYYYRVGAAFPAFEDLDRDDDGRLSPAELAAYYHDAATDVLRPRFVPADSTFASRVTKDLFARLDRNGDGKLTRDEMAAAAAALVTADRDEDECLTPDEILRRESAEEEPTTPAPVKPAAASATLFVSAGPPNRDVVGMLVAKYDRDGDRKLTPAELGFDAARFKRFDADADGKLTAAELDVWRTGPPDFAVTVNVGPTAADGAVSVTAAGDGAAGVEARPGKHGRVVLRVGSQFLDLLAAPPTADGPRRRLDRELGQTFPPNKQVVTEDDIAGPQFQFLRIVFDSADANGDGKLTRAEFSAYLGLQQATLDLATSAAFATRTPGLFSHMDEDGDGRLSVRELRTAYDRLIVLEPGGGSAVTVAALQPAAAVRVGPATSADPNTGVSPFDRGQPPRDKGPLWFRKMDRNSDGDVSRSEFLGPAADFAAIDADGDGLIAADEATAFDKKVRPAGK